ncbi:MAG: hypothetical protein DRI57_13525 [Deltaproteobacteria bacterium]|nr:MAG: hypothetical protein DRI57_13525 [Deltaproteobacteria bacterium]
MQIVFRHKTICKIVLQTTAKLFYKQFAKLFYKQFAKLALVQFNGIFRGKSPGLILKNNRLSDFLAYCAAG